MVVLPLGAISGALSRARPGHAADHQPGPRANAGPTASAERSTRSRTDEGTDHGTPHAGIDSRLIGCRAAHLILRVLSAFDIVAAEIIEVLAGARQRHHARAGRHARTSAEQQDARQGDHRKIGFHRHPFNLAAGQPVAGQLSANLRDTP